MYRWRKIIISSVKNQTSIRLAQKALRLAPDNLEALELLAAAYEKDNRLSDSIKAYESILRLNPHDNRDPLQSDRFAAVDR
jgi:cytochrome c-type biogenesis protein CcmH/NrfG